MKMCIPARTNDALESKVSGHFGSSPYFFIYNTENNEFEVIDNSSTEHIHGVNCPGSTISQKDIDCVVCNGIGGRALQNFTQAGMKVYKAEGKTIANVVSNFAQASAAEITPDSPFVHRTHH